MANLSGFNAGTTPPMEERGVIPDGDYRALITESKVKETKAHDGASFLEFTWELLDDPHKKRKQWSRLNLWNPSNNAVEIAQRELSSICRAINVLTPNDSEELHGIPCLLRIGHEVRNDPGHEGEVANRIKGYLPLNAAPQPVATTAAVPATVPAPAAPARPAAPATPPWRQ